MPRCSKNISTTYSDTFRGYRHNISSYNSRLNPTTKLSPERIAGARKLPVGPSSDLHTNSDVTLSWESLNVATFFPRTANTVVALPMTFLRSLAAKEVLRALSTTTGVNPAWARNSCDLVQVVQLGRWKYQSIGSVIMLLSRGGKCIWVKKHADKFTPSA